MEYTDKQIEQIKTELNALDIDKVYEEFLTDTYGDIEICGQIFDSASALKELDPTGFDCGCADYIDCLQSDKLVEEVDGDYYWTSEIEAIDFEDEEEEEEDGE